MLSSKELMLNARKHKKVIPSFNVSYLPMVEPVVKACRDANSFGQIAVAQADWVKFEAGSLKAAYHEYQKHQDRQFVTLHLDHVPVTEDGQDIDYESIIAEALELGYDSVMIDGSMLELEDNIAATKTITSMAHAVGVPVEAEIGAVVGYNGLGMPYEELFASRMGFTDIDQAKQLVAQTSADWLSVAVGNIHGALTDAQRNSKKATARLDINHLKTIYQLVGLPLVLHGGSGIDRKYIADGVQNGIAKINIATAIRQPYELGRKESIEAAQEGVYQAAYRVLTQELGMKDSADVINPAAQTPLPRGE